MAEREPDKQRRDDEGAAKCCGLRPAVVAAAGVGAAGETSRRHPEDQA